MQWNEVYVNEEVLRLSRQLSSKYISHLRRYPCFHCSRNLMWVKDKGLAYVEAEYNGRFVKLHRGCYYSFVEQLRGV